MDNSKEYDELIKTVADWIGNNQSYVKLAQKISRYIIDNQLLNSDRVQPYQLFPHENDNFSISVHLDHPIHGHYWIHLVDENDIQFMPDDIDWEKFIHTSKSFASTKKYIDKLLHGEIAKFREIEALVIKRDRKAVNAVINDLLFKYRTKVDTHISGLKDYLSNITTLVVVSNIDPKNPKHIPFRDYKGGLDDLLMSQNDWIFDANIDSKTKISEEEITNKIRSFIILEKSLSSIIYATQMIAANADWKVQIINDHKLNVLEPEKWAQKDPKTGLVQVRSILKAKEIIIHSSLEL